MPRKTPGEDSNLGGLMTKVAGAENVAGMPLPVRRGTCFRADDQHRATGRAEQNLRIAAKEQPLKTGVDIRPQHDQIAARIS